MDMTQLLITEFTGTSLALYKPYNNAFSVDELRAITEHLKDIADIKTLYVSNSKGKQSIQVITCTFKNEQTFSALMTQAQFLEAESPENTFYISGFQYDEENEHCTLYFHSMEPTGFTSTEMLRFTKKMYDLGAESVLNKRLDGKSSLHYRLHTFEIMSKQHFFEPIHELSCTFKNDSVGQNIIKQIFKQHSKAPNPMVRDCYDSCIISAYKDASTCTLLTLNVCDFFTQRNLSQICSWLHILGAKSVITKLHNICGRIKNPSIECTFDPDDESFDVKLNDFITYKNKLFISNEKSCGNLAENAKEYFPNLYLTLSTDGNSFIVMNNSDGTEEFSRPERGYFLSKFYQLGAESIVTEEHFIKCTFADNENGRRLRAQAIYKLLGG